MNTSFHAIEAIALAIALASMLYALVQLAKIIRYGIFPGPFNPNSGIDAKFDVLVAAQCVLFAFGVTIMAFIYLQHVNF